MAFLRVERKKSGTYLRIVHSVRVNGIPRHQTLHSLGKLEDYSTDQIERIAEKLLALAGKNIEDIIKDNLHELSRVNYGYALIIQYLWKQFELDKLCRKINNRSRVKFKWEDALRIMLAERLNEPCSKRQNSFNQKEYIGLSDKMIPIHHFYRSLDVLSTYEELIKNHLFSQQSNLFTAKLDVVFYDVTTLYFDSQLEIPDALRQKGYSKDGKAHKTQVVLGLLVDKLRNPISYQIYQGNTYESGTMIQALKKMSEQYDIDRVVVVADTSMIDKSNRDYMVEQDINYIIGDSIKNLGKKITSQLLDTTAHISLASPQSETRSYREIKYKGRRIICTYSSKRARKDAHERQKLIDKAKLWLEEPSKYKQVKNRGAGRYISKDDQGTPLQLDDQRISNDARFDGFKAISTTTKLEVEEVLTKYSDLFEVEHTFRALKSQLEIRPVFHWTDKHIRGHICMCFIAFTMLNRLRNTTQMQYRELQRSMDKMQLSLIHDDTDDSRFYLRSKLDAPQEKLIQALKLKAPNDTTPQYAVNQYFTK